MENNFDVSKNNEGKYEVHLNIIGNYMFEAESKKVAVSIVEALENKIPKKASPKEHVGGGVGYCPKCVEKPVTDHFNYCPGCGQMLDWS